MFKIDSKLAKKCENCESGSQCFHNRCQDVSTDQNKSSDQSWIRKSSVVTIYLMQMQIRKTPSPPPDPICWNVAMANANIASLSRSKRQGMASLYLWLPCQYLPLPIHHSLLGHVHEARLTVLINCSWCLEHITLEHSLKAEPQNLCFLNGGSSRWKPGMTPFLPKKVQGETVKQCFQIQVAAIGLHNKHHTWNAKHWPHRHSSIETVSCPVWDAPGGFSTLLT